MATQLNNWLSIDKTSGTGNAEITLTASSYSELVDRVASLKIQGIRANAILNVRQKAYSLNEEELKQQYFWVEFEQAGGTISGLTNQYTDMYHSFNGSTWETTPNTLSMGDKTLVYFRNDSKKIADNIQLNIIFNSNAKVGGDISSLTDMAKSCCYGLFRNNTYITDASKLILPWDTLANGCFYIMFDGCTNLTTVPELPATTLAESCYSHMFQGCSSLTTAPVLPATTLANNCYEYMFTNCANLTTAPVLPATTLKYECYASMFKGCTSLTTAPVLPATTLAEYCYAAMFNGCKNLTTAPVLPATTLAERCYQYMFGSCKNLKYIKMLATSISASYCLNKWVDGVSSTGTFVKHPDANLPRGASGIPSGWTVETATE